VKGPRRVYELDTDGLLADLMARLADEGFDVVEQIPVGVWWIATEPGGKADLCEQLGRLFQRLVTERLREVEQ
jgi:hypothetical protein